MNLEQAQPDRAARPQPAGQTRLYGGWLTLARVAFCAVVVLVLLLFLVSLPSYLTYLQTVCLHQPCPYQQLTLNSARSLQALSISVEGYAALTLTLTLAAAFVWMVMGTVLVWRRSDDWMALLVAFMLVVGGANNALYSGFTVSQAGGNVPTNLLGFLFSSALFVVFSLFPSGHFSPRWIRWLIPAFLLNNFLYQFFPDWYAHLPGWARLVGLLAFSGSLLLLVLAQMYRYWRVSTQVQRQQTKWILFSFTLGIASTLIWIFLENIIPSLNGSLYDPANAYLSDLGSLLLPISFTIAIMRYRLWDIDIIIHRTLVYGALTACVVGLYVFVVGYLGALFRTGSTLPISLVATGLVAVLFQPLRELLQRGVNRLLYGQRDEPYRVVSRLGQRLEATLAPEAVLPTIVETVAQALKLPYAAITLQQDGAVVNAATFGKAVDELLHLPLSYQSELIGELVLAPRSPGESFTPADRALLSDLARQAGAAAHAVRLTMDLQRLAGELQQSRTQLVSAREEERRRLRRDLHDGLGPQLASLTLKLETARNKLAHDPLADRLLAELTSRTQTAVADIRRLVYALRPPALDELGLLSALREQAFQYSKLGQSPLLITYQAPESLPPLPAAVEVAVYRIAQEALTNVVRHAQADQCHLRLILDAAAGVLSLEIQDNGCGLSPTHRSGVGLASMRERAEELGGTWTIESASTGGARILTRFPFLSPETGDSTHPQQLSLTEEEDEL